MNKREQTTGLPKAPKKPEADPAAPQKGTPLSREYRSRAEREAELQRYVILGTGIATAVVVIVLVIALIIDQLIVPNQTVATVEGQAISVAQFQKRVRLERVLRIQRLQSFISTYQSFGFPDDQIAQQLQSQEPYRSWYNELQIPDQMGLTVINEIADEQVIRNAAAAQNITVSQEEIQEEINQFFGYDPVALAEAESTAEATETAEPSATPTPYVSPTPSPTPTITPTPEFTATPSPTPLATIPPEPTLTTTQQAEQFNTTRNDFYGVLRSETGMSDADINAYFETIALRKALRDAVTPEITDKGLFADVRHILVETEEEAQDVIAALNAGESFADLARAVSKDTGSGANGGELDWAPVTQYVKPFQDAVINAEIGEIAGPVESEFGFHIIQVRAREERDLSEDQIENAKESAFATWLEDLKTSKQDQIKIEQTWVNYVPNDPPSPFG